jgi:hypothetical protein
VKDTSRQETPPPMAGREPEPPQGGEIPRPMGLGGSQRVDHTHVEDFLHAQSLFSLMASYRAILQSSLGAPTNWRAGCGKPACPVRERGRFDPVPISSKSRIHHSDTVLLNTL